MCRSSRRETGAVLDRRVPKGLFSGLVEGDTRGREGKIKTQIEAKHSRFDLERRSKGVSGAERTLLRRSGRT